MISKQNKPDGSISREHDDFLARIRSKEISPTAIAIVLYSLSVLHRGNTVCFDHNLIFEKLGLRRTAYYLAIKALKECGVIVKIAKDTYRINIETVLDRRTIPSS